MYDALWSIAQTVGEIVAELWWFILLAVIIASVMSTLKLDRKVAQFFHRAGVWGTLGALLLGLVSPLWAIGVLPAVAAMLAAGAPMAPVMVFLISSPLMSPSAFFITLGGLGLSMALWKLFSAIALGLAAGWITGLLSRQGYLGKSILRIPRDSREETQENSCSNSCSASVEEANAESEATITKANLLTFLRLSGKFGLFIGKFTIIAIIAQAFMVRFVPQDWITTAVGMQNSYAVLISTIVGIPAYLNSLSAVPLLRGLMDLGMDKGAALAFIIAGPVMSVPSIIAVMALFKRQALYVYVTVGFLGALLFGYVYRLL